MNLEVIESDLDVFYFLIFIFHLFFTVVDFYVLFW